MPFPQSDTSEKNILSKIASKILGHQIEYGRLFPYMSREESHELRLKIRKDATLSRGYMMMCFLSAAIAQIGLFQSSPTVAIGAMLISPLMQPIAALGFAIASFDGREIRNSLKVLMVGVIIGIITGAIITFISPIKNVTSEILARTEPTLLDLAVALLSGFAGGYATVNRNIPVAVIGVAIATALMPPLTTIGYGIGVLNYHFILGALLLFLTNLAAISLAFAVTARISHAARPMANVEITLKYIFIAIGALIMLAIPLAMSLVKVAHETTAQNVTRRVLSNEFANGTITRIDIKWDIAREPQINAIVVTPNYKKDATETIKTEISKRLKANATINLQQIVAADINGQTNDMVNKAITRAASEISKDNPPIQDVISLLQIPISNVFTDYNNHALLINPQKMTGWTLYDYYLLEEKAQSINSDWKINIIPPFENYYIVEIDENSSIANRELYLWLLQRLGITNLRLLGTADNNAIQGFADYFKNNGINTAYIAMDNKELGAINPDIKDFTKTIILDITPQRPTQTR